MTHQCKSCGGFCGKSGCERLNTNHPDYDKTGAAQREAFEAWAEPILGDNPTWRESGDCELAWQAWQAAQPAQNEWKEAVIEQLAAHSIDAPVSASPTVVLAKIIHTAVMMATDPSINAPNPEQACEPNEFQVRAIAIVMKSGRVSVSEVQRKLNIGYNDSQALCQSLVDGGWVGGLPLAPGLSKRAAQPDTEALRKELERVKGERDAYRAFIYNLSGSAGGMVNGNRLSISANKVLGFGEVCGKQPEGTPPTNPAESVNCCPGSPGWPVALRDSTIDTITDACFQAVADQGTTVLMRAVARAVERQHGIAAQGEAKE